MIDDAGLVCLERDEWNRRDNVIMVCIYVYYESVCGLIVYSLLTATAILLTMGDL